MHESADSRAAVSYSNRQKSCLSISLADFRRDARGASQHWWLPGTGHLVALEDVPETPLGVVENRRMANNIVLIVSQILRQDCRNRQGR